LGDKSQLPSIEAGSVLAEMIPDDAGSAKFKDRFIILKNVYRSGDVLRDAADRINRGQFSPDRAIPFAEALSQEPDRWAFVQAEQIDKWRERLFQWTSHQYLSPIPGDAKSFTELIAEAGELTDDQLVDSEHGRDLLHRLFRGVRQARILAILRSGMYGCEGINAIIADRLVTVLDRTTDFQTDLFAGALIIITRNDYSKDLFNGDIGVVIKDAANTYKAYFNRSEGYVSFPVSQLPPWELAFAMTVHKSQGSEFEDVLLVLPDDEKHRLLTREIVYTGVTRAKKRIILYGKQTAIHTALNRKIERLSGLMWK
jgi:exodeoxyribonuclease V alpha subunit